MRMARAWHVQAPFYAELLEEAHYANAAFYTSNYGQFPTNGKYEWLWLVGCDQQARGWLEAARHPKTAELRTAKLGRIAKLVEELHNVGKLPEGIELHEVQATLAAALGDDPAAQSKAFDLVESLFRQVRHTPTPAPTPTLTPAPAPALALTLTCVGPSRQESGPGRMIRHHADLEQTRMRKNGQLRAKGAEDELLYVEVRAAH